ncbi:MAG: wbbL2 [Frankiales bacterium]|nr:wbbL2 [Frankiales bacterium]
MSAAVNSDGSSTVPPASVAVVTVTYSPGATLGSFLDSLQKASDHPVPVVLADNGSHDGAPEAATARDNVTLLRTGANLGFGQAANRGVAATGSEWVVVANPDVVWAPGSLDELMAAAQRWPRAGSLGPLIRTDAGDLYPSARELPSLGQGIGHALLGSRWPSNPWSAGYRRDNDAIAERPAGWLSGSCLLIRRAAFDAVGGFDPAYFMYFEDVDLGDRLGRAGWQNVYVPSAEVVHLGGHSTSKRRSDMLAEHHRSAWTYLARRYPGPRWAPVRWLLYAGLQLRARILNAKDGKGKR